MVFFPPKVPICPFLHFFFEKSVSELIVVHTRVERRINCLLVHELCACGPNSTFDGQRSVFMTQFLMFSSSHKNKKGNQTISEEANFLGAKNAVVLWKNFGVSGKSRFVCVQAVSWANRGRRALVPKNNTFFKTQSETYIFCAELQELSDAYFTIYIAVWGNGFFSQFVPICPFPHFSSQKSVPELIVGHTRVERRINCLLVQELCVCGPSSTFDGPRSVFKTQLLMFWPTKQLKKGSFPRFFFLRFATFCSNEFFFVFLGKNYGGTGKSQFAGAHAVSTTQDWYRYGVTTYNHGGRTHFSTIHFISCFSVARQMVRRSSNF